MSHPQYPHNLSYQSPGAAKAKTWLVESILATLFCCLPFGIVGIVFAAMTKSNNDNGNLSLAHEYSAKARMWTLLSFGIGLVGTILYVVVVIIAETA